NPFGLFTAATETDVASLHHIMVSTLASRRFVFGYEGMSVGIDRLALGVDCDLVHSFICVGDSAAAQNIPYLQAMGVTHVLNVAEGNGPGMVSTTARTYAGTGIDYLGLPIVDSPLYDISQHFQEATTFIDRCQGNGKVLVHCLRGRSRSPAVVLAYLMIRYNTPAPMGLRLLSSKRSLNINYGFLDKLADLHNHLCVAASNN
ncbi:Dual specificity protein phosphatase 3, partial [Frankliniella fusca]